MRVISTNFTRLSALFSMSFGYELIQLTRVTLFCILSSDSTCCVSLYPYERKWRLPFVPTERHSRQGITRRTRNEAGDYARTAIIICVFVGFLVIFISFSVLARLHHTIRIVSLLFLFLLPF